MNRFPQPDEPTLNRAHVGLEASVGADVGPQIEVQRELLCADFALVGFLASVDQLMSLQLRLVQKLFVARSHLAHVLSLPMGRHVLFEGALVREDLATVLDFAAERADALLFFGDRFLDFFFAFNDWLNNF